MYVSVLSLSVCVSVYTFVFGCLVCDGCLFGLYVRLIVCFVFVCLCFVFFHMGLLWRDTLGFDLGSRGFRFIVVLERK